MNLIIHPKATEEVHEAFIWYESKKEGLGFEFAEEIEEGYKKISDNPESYTTINKTYRRFLLKRFPYIIVYEITDNAVTVISVRHSKRKR